MIPQPTPQPVIDAMHIIAAHLRARGYAECIVAPTGGGSFLQRTSSDRFDELADAYLALIDPRRRPKRIARAKQPIRRTCGTCTIEIWPVTRFLRTVFPDGTMVPATPNYDPASIAHAYALGYAGDSWAMSREHEALHTWMAVQAGQAYSVTLWHVAHGTRPPIGVAPAEEALVLHFQGYLHAGRPAPYLVQQWAATTGKPLAQLAEEARAFLATLFPYYGGTE